MAASADSIRTPRREDGEVLRDLKDLEYQIHVVATLARIAANFGEDLLKFDNAEKKGDRFVFSFGRDELEDMSFLAGEAESRAAALLSGFHTAISGRAA